MKAGHSLRAYGLSLVCALLAGPLAAETWRFAVIGDTPYSDYERRQIVPMLADIAEAHVAFIVHVGDFKSSGATCSDELFRDRQALFASSPTPLIYVPGDNEWTDCRRVRTGHFGPIERLEKLRELFFAEPWSLGQQRVAVEQQPGPYREHLRWRLGPVLLVSLNVPGPNNNYGLGQQPGHEFLQRNPVVVEWLRQGFDLARREGLAGIVVAMQGDPGFKDDAVALTHAGYRQLLASLRQETLNFPGQVLLVHGDTHRLRIDKPLRHPRSGEPIANFTRVETYGYPLMGWIKVIIDTGEPGLFRFETYPHPRR